MWDYRGAVRTEQALRELITNVAAIDDTDAGQLAEGRADEILGVIVHNRESAGRIMLAMASFIVYTWIEEPGGPTVDVAIDTLTSAGDTLPGFRELLQAFADAYRGGEKLNAEAIALSGEITLDPMNAAMILWAMTFYLGFAAPKDETERLSFIDGFVVSSIRQEFVRDVELEAPPEA
jgi:hypothetical protein